MRRDLMVWRGIGIAVETGFVAICILIGLKFGFSGLEIFLCIVIATIALFIIYWVAKFLILFFKN